VKLVEKPAKVLIGVPTYDGNVRMGTAMALMAAHKRPEFHDIECKTVFQSGSLLAFTFNGLWARALNGRAMGFTHFAMLHADLVPDPNWVVALLEEMQSNDADVISAVVPLKGPQGLTSTGVDDPDDEWRVRRFTLKQLATMPRTFTSDKLVINTGCMLVDLRKDWVDKICFRMQDGIEHGLTGATPLVVSEDWLFSRDVRGFGGKLFATTRVGVQHFGTQSWNNREWFDYQWDEDQTNGKAEL
jgi:hypothetical protein